MRARLTDATVVRDDERYADLHPTWHEEHAEWKADFVATMLRDHAIPVHRVCDIGCGTAGVLDRLSGLLEGAPTLVGYEISERALAAAPDGRARRVELVLGIDDDRHFDVALVLDVIEHVDDDRAFLREIRSKADWFVFHIPLDRAVAATIRPGQLDRLRTIMGHVRYYTRTTALEALRATGYDIVDWRYTCPAVDHPTTRLQRAVRLPRRIAFRLVPGLAARVLGGCSLCVLARPVDAS